MIDPSETPESAPQAPKHWADNFVAFDTETTGFSNKARVIEVAVVRFEHGKPTQTYATLINPGDDLDWQSSETIGALKINNLSREQLEGQPPFEDIFAQLMLQFAAAPVWVAHNKSFDLRMLRQEREFITAKYQREYSVMVPKPKAVLDTMLIDVGLDARPTSSRKLEQVASRWLIRNEDEQNLHRAQADTELCGRVLLAMLKCPELSNLSLAQVIEFHKEADKAWSGMRAQAYAQAKNRNRRS